MPEMIPVDSSNIRAIGYDDDTAELYVEFHTSGLYAYSGVPRPVFDAFLAAPSKGEFHAREVKHVYPYRKE